MMYLEIFGSIALRLATLAVLLMLASPIVWASRGILVVPGRAIVNLKGSLLYHAHRFLVTLLVVMTFAAVPYSVIVCVRVLKETIVPLGAIYMVALWAFALINYLVYRRELRDRQPAST